MSLLVYFIDRFCGVPSALPSPPDGWRLLRKGKVYENESQILHTSVYKHTGRHPCSHGPPLPPSLALCQEAICLGKPKGDLVCSLHWKSNEDSNDGHSVEAIFVL